MSFKSSKIAIVGVGNVGATTAYTIINQGLCEEIVLIDVNKEKAVGEALDMQHSIFFMNRNINVHAGDYDECKDADIVIITASVPMDPNATNRLDMLSGSKRVMKSIISSIMGSGFNGILLVISNPVDVMTYYAWKLSGLPKNQVIGSGTTLDTARLAVEISNLFDLDSKSISAYVMGEHGDSEFVSWNTATIGGKRLIDVMNDNTERVNEESFDNLKEQTIKAGWEIFHRKGSTTYGIAASAAAIVKSILFNENKILPVSVYLEGEYGLDGVYLSAPTIINNTGAKEIVEINLAEDEKKAMDASNDIVKSFYEALNN
jgi:L-lactate dehydrogenase